MVIVTTSLSRLRLLGSWSRWRSCSCRLLKAVVFLLYFAPNILTTAAPLATGFSLDLHVSAQGIRRDAAGL